MNRRPTRAGDRVVFAALALAWFLGIAFAAVALEHRLQPLSEPIRSQPR